MKYCRWVCHWPGIAIRCHHAVSVSAVILSFLKKVLSLSTTSNIIDKSDLMKLKVCRYTTSRYHYGLVPIFFEQIWKSVLLSDAISPFWTVTRCQSKAWGGSRLKANSRRLSTMVVLFPLDFFFTGRKQNSTCINTCHQLTAHDNSELGITRIRIHFIHTRLNYAGR